MEIQFKCGVRIMYLCLYKNILFAGLSSGSVLFIDLKVCVCGGEGKERVRRDIKEGEEMGKQKGEGKEKVCSRWEREGKGGRRHCMD